MAIGDTKTGDATAEKVDIEKAAKIDTAPSGDTIDAGAETGAMPDGDLRTTVPSDRGEISAINHEQVQPGATHGPLGGGDSLPAPGAVGYDTVDIDGHDLDLLDETVLEGTVMVGGLDGRNDAAGGGVQSSPDGQPAQGGDPSEYVGKQSTHESNMEAVNNIQNNPNLSPEQKQERLDELGGRIKAGNDAAQSGEAADDGADAGPGSGEGAAAAPPPDAGVDGNTDGEEGGIVEFIKDVGKGVGEWFGYDMDNFWGNAGEGAPKGGLIGGTNLTGDEEGLELSETKKVLEAKAAASEALDESDSTTEDQGEEGGLQGPDLWGEFTDTYHEQGIESRTGADIDYGDQAQGHASEVGMANEETYTGSFDEGFSTPSQDQFDAAEAAIDTTPDEEFLEV